MSSAHVVAAYSSRAVEYIAALGSMGATAEPDRVLIETWATRVRGRILDIGCGPGQWTAWLHSLGHDVVGIDPTPAFLEHARASHPNVSFVDGRAESIDARTASIGGVLSWYSLIHTEPSRVPMALAEFARIIRPGGCLAIGFFEAPRLTPFAHAIATAYAWPIANMVELVTDAGFTVTQRQQRTDAGSRPHGAIVATRNATGIRP